jgi:hypothetical protein
METRGILWAVPVRPLPVSRRFPIAPHEHITLWYNCTGNDVAGFIGQSFRATVYQPESNEFIQACRVEFSGDVPCLGQIPHVTLSHTQDARPVASTEMLKSNPDPSSEIIGVFDFTVEFYEFRRPS